MTVISGTFYAGTGPCRNEHASASTRRCGPSTAQHYVDIFSRVLLSSEYPRWARASGDEIATCGQFVVRARDLERRTFPLLFAVHESRCGPERRFGDFRHGLHLG
jgi:hypothetical protein